MRNLLSIVGILALLGLALAAAAPAPTATAATLGGPQPEAGNCFYQCGCNGVVLWCCVTTSGVACKPATGPTPIQCPQIDDC